MLDNKNQEWDESFKNKNNYLFYPHEEVIRFVSKYVAKRTGYDEFEQIISARKMLDLGCGIGRHVIYGCQNGIDSYGVDLSEEGISYAKKFALKNGIDSIDERFIVSDIRNLPWDDGEFNIVVSHGVLDSMSYEIAQESVRELFRITSNGALFYCDLICSPDSDIDIEEVVETSHEKGTVQSFFTTSKIKNLFSGTFSIIEKIKVLRYNDLTGISTARWHLVLKRD